MYYFYLLHEARSFNFLKKFVLQDEDLQEIKDLVQKVETQRASFLMV